MASVAAKPALSVDTSLASNQGRHPRQGNRAATHAARSAQAPRDELSQGGFSSDDEPQQQTMTKQQQQQQPRRTLVRQRSNEPQDDSSDEEGQQRNYTHHTPDGRHVELEGEDGEGGLVQQGIDVDEDDDEEYDDEEEDEEELDDDEDDDLSSSPSIPDENIDFDLVYALHTFVATVEGQATVNKGNSLTLLDDSNSYWWLVRVLRTQEVGYIPAENIETPFERLARLNKHRNVDLASATDDDHIQVPSKIYSSHLVKRRDAAGPEGMSVHSGKLSALSRRRDGASPQNPSPGPASKPSVIFGPSSYVEHSGDEMESEYDEDMDDAGEYEEDDEEGEDEEEDMDEDEVRGQLEQSEPDVRSRGQASVQQQQQTGPGSVDTAAGRREMLAGMDPDDGMDWDAKEAERIQSQKAAAAAAAAGAAGVGAAALAGGRGDASSDPQRGILRGQQVQEQGRAPGTSWDNAPMDERQPRPSRDQSQLGSGRPSLQGQSQQQQIRASYGSQQDQQQRPSTERTFSGESRDSAVGGSDGGFLPSQVQRDRTVSDASMASSSGSQAGNSYAAGGGPYGRGSPTPAQLRKDKELRRKSKQSSMDATDDSSATIDAGKEGKKRSGVFSGLFSRNKDKKDRKSGSFSSAGDESAIIGRPSEEGGRAGILRPSSNSGTTGMGKGVQERDRLTQEAYQRQFLSSDRSSLDPGQGQFISRPGGGKARPGSLMATPNSVPMLNVLRIFAGDDIGADSTFKTVLLNDSTSARDLVRQAMQRFRLGYGEFILSVKLLEGSERPLGPDEKPLQVFDRLSEMAPESAVMPSVKRSSVGSISSISSNLSLNPAIARVNEDFSDDHAVKFYLKRARSPSGRQGASPGSIGIQPGQIWSSSNAYAGESPDPSGLRAPVKIPGGLSPLGTPLEGPDMALSQSPQARFALRLVIFPNDLPEGLSFDPQTNALIPTTVLAERGPSGAAPADGVEQRFREKVLSLPRNATVAEVVEAGLDRFGIADGLVEGGDDVEERTSRRRSRPRVRYSLTVDVKRQGPGKERHLQPNSRVVEAYPTPPVFKASSSTSNKRRSNDSAMLLNMAEEQIRREDPVFVLRAVTAASANGAKAPPGKSVRSLSPTEGVLAERQQQRRQSELDATKLTGTAGVAGVGAAGAAAVAATAGGMTNSRSREVIAAQRAAAQERKAAVLGAQRNDQQGVDLYLVNDGKIRSSRSLEGGRVRYSYLPTAGGQEMDISSIVEDVLTIDAKEPSSADTGGTLTPTASGLRPKIPTRGASASTLQSQYMDAPSSPLPESSDPMAATKPSTATSDRDLLESFVRNPSSDEDTIEDRINQVLSRVTDANTSSSSSAGRRTPTTAQPSGTVTAPPRSAMRPGQHRKQGSGNVDGTSDRSYGSVYDSSPRSASTATDKSAATTNPTPISTLTTAAAAGGAGAGALAAGTVAAAGAGAIVVGGAAAAGASLAANSSNNASVAGSASSPRRRMANAGPAAFIPRDDFGLDHLYTLVDAAARRDPKKYVTRVVSRSASRAQTSRDSSGGGGIASRSASGSGGPTGPSPPASRHNSVVAVTTYAPEREKPRAQVAGLFPPPSNQMPSGLFRSATLAMSGGEAGAGGKAQQNAQQQQQVHQAYLPLEKQLDRIEDGLDALLEQALRAF
ncbi:hypothetical protein BDZ90DRAFT_230788 [Jaminaea rosea]|uniref:SH3 domain-containing protein n=1 Tax=Jaminaea rosea TaxID=1569628 RepID=A0A316UU15_9BASI|nr:hypothetical protein BDZ90DRAFT_230788 [Jaminaea rosea]PWN28779.1 hypothetical protein BDZ90DRAFT_230788 [Jaminaea rosea]